MTTKTDNFLRELLNVIQDQLNILNANDTAIRTEIGLLKSEIASSNMALTVLKSRIENQLEEIKEKKNKEAEESEEPDIKGKWQFWMAVITAVSAFLMALLNRIQIHFT